MRMWMLGIAAAGLVGTALLGTAGAQVAAPMDPAQPGAAPAQPAPSPAGRARVEAGAARLAAGDLPGPIDNPRDLVDTAKMLFLLADTNNDRQISQKEAIDAGNLLVGGFFFRADQNGDGVLTREEAQQARETLFQQQPILRFVFDRARRSLPQGGQPAPGAQPGQGTQGNPMNALTNLLDANNDQKLQASELRQAVQTGVQALYSAADTNRDSQLSPAELNAAVYAAARQGVRTAFQAADQDHNNALSKQEFAQAIVQPSNILFDILDANLDGQISEQELDTAGRIVVQQLRSRLTVPEPANSPANVIGNAVSPTPNQ